MTNRFPHYCDRILVASLAVFSVAVMAVVELAPRPSHNVAVVFSPWLKGADAVRRATASGASLVQAGRFPFILIVRPTSPTFSANALSRGALVVLDAQAVSGCFAAPGRPS